MRNLIITANSPGEVSLLKPVAREARELWPKVNIRVLLLPCTFATGQEGSVARELPGVTEIWPARRYLPLLLWQGGALGPTHLLHIGGDLMYSAFLSWRWGWSAWSYLWGRRWWDGAFTGYLCRDATSAAGLSRRGISPHKQHLVGDLIADAVGPPPATHQRRCITFMPGSRGSELEGLSPFFLEVAERMRAEQGDLEFQLLVSPFQSGERVRRRLVAPPLERVGGQQGRLEDDAQGRSWLVSPQGTRIRIRAGTPEALGASALAITIPGTKTAEAGVLGVPCLTILPLNRPEHLPFIGPLGLLDWVPGGRYLKGRVLVRMKDTIGLLAQPNLLAGQALMPEMVDVLSAASVAAEALRCWRDEANLQSVRARLNELYQPFQGAARRSLEQMCRP